MNNSLNNNWNFNLKNNSKKQRLHYNAFSFDFQNFQNFQNYPNNQFWQNLINNTNINSNFQQSHIDQKQIIQKGFNWKKKFKYCN